MKLVVFGSTGGLGKQIVNQALAEGHEVTAFARNPLAIDVNHALLKVFQGDVSDPKSVEDVIEGKDAVISALGVGSSWRSHGLMEQSMPIIARAMERQLVDRLIFTSGIVRKLDQVSFLPRTIMRIMLSDQIRDKRAGEVLLRKSKVEWTLIYPTILTNGPLTGQYRSGTRLELRGFPKISRADVANFILKLIKDKNSVREEIVLSY
jgi:putative NADH-flavin reductase